MKNTNVELKMNCWWDAHKWHGPLSIIDCGTVWPSWYEQWL